MHTCPGIKVDKMRINKDLSLLGLKDRSASKLQASCVFSNPESNTHIRWPHWRNLWCHKWVLMSARSALTTPLSRWPLCFFMSSTPANTRNPIYIRNKYNSPALFLFSPCRLLCNSQLKERWLQGKRDSRTPKIIPQTRSIPPFNAAQERTKCLVFPEPAHW